MDSRYHVLVNSAVDVMHPASIFEEIELELIAERESWRKELFRPQYHLHKWWARRLGSTTRAALISVLTNQPQRLESFYKDWDLKDNVVLDPFMGSGTTVGEALKLGCSAIGSDINSLSTFIVDTTMNRVNWKEFIDFANEFLNSFIDDFKELYITKDPQGKSREIDQILWRMRKTCIHCGKESSIRTTNLISRHAYPKKVAKIVSLCPNCNTLNLGSFNDEECLCILCSEKYKIREGNTKGKNYCCSYCGKTSPIGEKSQLPNYEMLAIRYRDADGRIAFKSPDENDLLVFNSIEFDEEVEKYVRIPPGETTGQITSGGFTNWHELFNHRQTWVIKKLIQRIELLEGVTKDRMQLLLSASLEYYCVMSTYKGEGTGAVRSAFSRHIFASERLYAENNILGNSEKSGTLLGMLHHRFKRYASYLESPFEIGPSAEKFKPVPIKNHKAIDLFHDSTSFFQSNERQRLMIRNADARMIDIPDEAIDAVVTDPPYFDMIDYSELADFFYYWIRQMRPTDTLFSSPSSVHEGDIHGNNLKAFEDKLSKSFREIYRVLKYNRYLVFSFQHQDAGPWRALKRMVIEAGFVITAAPLVRAENSLRLSSVGVKPSRYDVMIYCLKPQPNSFTGKYIQKKNANLLRKNELVLFEYANNILLA